MNGRRLPPRIIGVDHARGFPALMLAKNYTTLYRRVAKHRSSRYTKQTCESPHKRSLRLLNEQVEERASVYVRHSTLQVIQHCDVLKGVR